MGHYTKDPATLAALNQGLPPDEHATVVYIMDETEKRRARWDAERFEELARIRARARVAR